MNSGTLLVARPSVLIVDDDAALRRALRRCLASRYECEEAESAGEATVLVTSLRVDVIVIDVTLSDGSGLDWIRDHRTACANAGIIVLSGSMAREEAQQALDDGADAVLLKPCPPSELRAAIERALTLRDARRSLPAAGVA